MKIAVIDDSGFGSGKGLFGKELYVELLAKVNEDILGNKAIRILLGSSSEDNRIVGIIGLKTPIIRDFRDEILRQKLEEVLKDEKPDIIHVNVANARYPRNIVNVAKKMDIPIVTTVHSWMYVCPSGWAVKLPEQIICSNLGVQTHCIRCLMKVAELYKENKVSRLIDGINLHYSLRSLLRNSKAVISPCKSLAKSIEQSLKLKRIYTLPNLIPEELINMEPKYGGRNAVAFCARLNYQKGVHLLSDMAQRLPETTFNVMGAGLLEEEVRKSSREYKNIIYHGFVSKEKVEIISRCRAVIMPVLGFEAFGYTVAEAFSLGKPVIGFAVGGVKEMIEDSGAGFAVSPFDVNKFTKSITSIVENEGFSKELGLRGRAFAEKKLGPHLYAEQIQTIYRNVMNY
ncbi:MAG: glycosyltransferase family 4 protein [Nitrososphaeria archaeon]|jgi:glycosyltransferase involved in cell wall biosynthesis